MGGGGLEQWSGSKHGFGLGLPFGCDIGDVDLNNCFNRTVAERLSCTSQVSTGSSEPCRVRCVPRSN